jgi:phosphoribosylformylglycinamidine synthase
LLCLPIAHGEGRYVVDPEKYEELDRKGQIIFRYKEDINGSYERIAGITNERMNVCGMMPHPERASDLRSRDGMKIWNAVRKMVEGKK